MEQFGETIRKLRKERNLTLRKVAAFLDIDQAILSKIETGHRRASRENVVKLAEYLAVSQDELLINWLSDKIVYQVEENREIALDALLVAEEKIRYRNTSGLDKKAIINKICEFLMADGRVSKAWIFGSFARGNENYSSDIDLMVSYSDKASGTLLDYADIKFKLEQLLNREVDLVEEGYARNFAIDGINRDKILIYG